MFFHHLKGDWNAELRNPELGICAHMTWSGDTLPILVQWRSMASGDYALGLEPTNSYMNGRAGERENGTLPVLKAWESITHRVEIEFSTLA